jgi:flavin-dependent dehydrogenase
MGCFPALVERLRGAAAVTPVLGAGPLRQRAAAPRSGRVLLVGDAGGYLDALTGEGVSVGLATARAAVAAVAADRPEAYDDGWARATRRYRTLTGALLWASGRPRLRRGLVPLARRLPRVYTYAVNAVCA